MELPVLATGVKQVLILLLQIHLHANNALLVKLVFLVLPVAQLAVPEVSIFIISSFVLAFLYVFLRPITAYAYANTKCVTCVAGTFSAVSGSTNCTSCSDGYSSSAGASSCSTCSPGSIHVLFRLLLLLKIYFDNQ